ncbi:colanic acid biosynthesis acetyltransferase WcaF [Pontibacter sp. BT310]|uniref:WcaF family extracellular polysaccharide biosynthesis acetyltransferase n=1 Tax=Pontibacter populi TaxID=890055 RepID=A0ABS6XF97_9BACT|nr:MULTISPECIES: WcaF family extracellular polysaccharide biosynthesis acetyltransferase [Pontibacter]MBJ6119808.1 colanic acid biosynthesis acetyltransferase WcaF [Pontibacter sp. BT310]MBR0572237.1 WcaF family extracellular polysaccharide biosynthesis acetyltransferase [Microvirga sp. STS03]MBW3366661.1 WcaF family extracellular polysaccharide biosynthesis acetyltransferase [Pontibacter populi]
MALQAENSTAVNLSAYNNNWYKPGAGVVKRTVWYFVNGLFFINPLNPLSSLKVLLLRLFGATIGKGVVIKPMVNIKYPWLLNIGNHVWIGEKVWIDNLAQVTIEDNVTLSQGAMLLTGSHNYKKTTFDLIIGSITLEEGVWIGAKAIVCPGIICHTHSILTAGSVATQNLAAYTISQGNPATSKRERIITP